MDIYSRSKALINEINELEINQKAIIKEKARLENSIVKLKESNKLASEELEIVTNAITILRDVSDEAVQLSYTFITDSLNAALDRIFTTSVRKINIKEYTRSGQYPQLELELTVEGGATRSLKLDSGHGLMQIVSLLCILSLIVITGSRRLLVMDEILSGLSAKARSTINDILWTFTEIGFQFVVNEHGFVPAGSHVHKLKMVGGVSSVVENYIEPAGVYLNGTEMIDGEFEDNGEDNVSLDSNVGEI